LLYVLVGFIPLQLLKENQNIVLGVLAAIALAVGYGFLSTFDKWIEQAFSELPLSLFNNSSTLVLALF